MTTAKIVRFHETGNASVLKIASEPLIEPGPGEVRIQVEAIGLNRAEIMFREGSYLEEAVLPSKLGYEASGIVDALGEGVEALAIGDRVSTVPSFSMSQYGVYGESAIVPASAALKYDSSLSPIQATAIWMPFITVYGALIDIGQLQQEDTLLVTAASSSVGVAAIQLAKSVGAKVIATSRGKKKADFLLEMGADAVIQTDNQPLAETVMELTDGQGARLIFDPIGGAMLTELADAAATQGVIIEYGALDNEPPAYPLFASLGKGLTIRDTHCLKFLKTPNASRLQ